MKIKLIQAIYIIALLIPLGFVPPAACRSLPALVETGWLANNLNAKNLLLIDIRTASNYKVGHLPGAVSMPYAEWNSYNDDLECQLLPKSTDFAKKLRAIGLNSDSRVVIYDHGNTTSDATKGTYAVWALEAMGHDNVSYLNGGFTKWTFEGLIINNKKPTPQPGNFKIQTSSSKIATLEYVKSQLNSNKVLFVDARNSNEFFGTHKRADVARYGHIPGAISLPATFLNNAGINRAPASILPLKKLEAMAAGMGIPADKNKELIIYCNTGQYAALDYFVLHDLLGYRNARLFDGSMLEYAVQYKLPSVKYSWGR